MKRADISKAIKIVQDALVQSSLERAISLAIDKIRSTLSTEREKTSIDETLLIALNRYSVLANDYGPIEQKIAVICRISTISNPSTWVGAIFASEKHENYANLMKLQSLVSFAIESLPKFGNLLEADYQAFKDDTLENRPKEFENLEFLTVTLTETKDYLFVLNRFIQLFSSVSALYQTACKITECNNIPILLIGCDSGSEKVFDFVGASDAIKEIKEIILNVWDKIIFYKEHKLSQRIELIAEALPVLEKLAEMEKQGELSQEESGILRMGTVNAVKGLINCGAVTPEMEKRSVFKPQELMMPEQKLLTEGDEKNNLDIKEEKKDKPGKRGRI